MQQVVDQRGREDRLAGPAQTGDADAQVAVEHAVGQFADPVERPSAQVGQIAKW